MAGLIATLDVIGAACFLLAALVAGGNYAKTKDLSLFWMVFLVASVIGFFWAAMVAAEWLNIYPTLMDQIEQPVEAAMVTAYAIAGLLSLAKKFLFVS
jgi:hypothetical protein